MSSVERLILVLLVLLAGVGVALGSDSGGGGGSSAPEPGSSFAVAPIETVSDRVERLRGLEFERPVPRRDVSAEQARKEGLADFDRSYPPERRRRDELGSALLGAVPAGTDFRKLTSSIFGEEVAGFYNPRSGRLSLVDDGQGGASAFDEIILAHELGHALEDQRFDLEELSGGQDDRAAARSALIEGSATALMVDYARENLSAAALGASLGASSGTDLPPFIEAGLLFPYLGGLEWITAVRKRGGWNAVDRAFRSRPPASTEQILHPAKYFAGEVGEAVTIDADGPGDGWKAFPPGNLGEFSTRELIDLALTSSDAETAAAGWDGDAYRVWQREDAPDDCKTPCREFSALRSVWRWDSPKDAAEFRGALQVYLLQGLEATPNGIDRWRLDGGFAAVDSDETSVSLALAPDQGLAISLARRLR